MDLLITWRSLYTLRYVSITLIQVVFSAGTIFLSSAVQATSGSRLAPVSLSHSLSQVRLCLQYLSESGKSWQCANHIAEILRNLLQERLVPKLLRHSVDQSRIFSTPSPSPNLQPYSVDDPKSPVSFVGPVSTPIEMISAGLFPELLSSVYDRRASSSSITTCQAYTNGDLGSPFGTSDLISNRGEGSDTICRADPSVINHSFSGLGPGMLGGEAISNQPFMPFGMPDQWIGFDGYYSQPQLSLSEQGPYAPLDLTEEDLSLLQYLLNQQQPV